MADIRVIPPLSGDYTPDQFTFVDQTDVALNSTVTSAPITITGVSPGTVIPFSLDTGLWSKDGVTFVSGSGNVTLNDQVYLRHTASGSVSTNTNQTLTIGGVQATFTSTTTASAGDYSAYYARVPFAIEQPTEPTISNEVTILTTGTQAGTDAMDALATPGTKVIIPNAAGNIGNLKLGGITNGYIEMGSDVIVTDIQFGQLRSFALSPTNTLKITGGNIRYARFRETNSNIIFDGCVFDNDQGLGVSGNTEMFRFSPATASVFLDRLLVINCMTKVFPDPRASFNLGGFARNVMWANSNFSNSLNTTNAWGWRLSGGTNWAFLDCCVLVASQKMVRTDDAPVTNVFIDGGTWMREDATFPDAWAQIVPSPVTGVTIQNLECWFAESGAEAIRVGFNFSETGNGTWDMSNIDFYATSSTVVSDATLNSAESGAGSGTPNYGAGTHTYTYNVPTTLPTDRWRVLPALPNNGNPEALSYP